MSDTVTIKFPTGESYKQPTGIFINNEFRPAQSGETSDVINPSTEEVITKVSKGNSKDVDDAVNAADEAFHEWSQTEPYQRSLLLLKLADLIERDQDIIAKIDSLNNGKALKWAKTDVGLLIRSLRSTAGAYDKINGRTIDTSNDYLTYTKREPLGVCGQVIPWNFPILMWGWKIAPAVITGNTVVLKPASATPLSALYTSQLVKEAGFPPGVINTLIGSGRDAGDHMLRHPKIRKTAFTGSTEIGREILISSGESNLKKISVELGGKSPNIVFNDVESKIDQVVDSLIFGIFYNNGEVCCAGSRIYVQSGIYDKIVSKLVEKTKSLKIGDPFDKDVFHGSQAIKSQFDTVLDYIEKGKKEGAKILVGGERIGKKGYFIQPTIFETDNEDYSVVKEEIFGPVATISKFTTVDEVIQKANDSEFGLASGLHTNDLNVALEVSNRLQAGTVWVNTFNDLQESTPFGGYKQSGFGREMGTEVFDNYTQVKSVRIKFDHKNALTEGKV
ncbi:Retinal dehydrogenase [Wickerhamomyces ciferrii]|uniref:Aldehyde dehydrogenase 5, mitochondrial n=1 Tax=Wickerhamomyces ciferrii (strain ATCC 14091 / BCRC 22168 / CBS 111 / JCM 3599 / NBRC 0793 / NRRL Y-1031 F-60-10) TaxID=1206466 RepID=K0KZV9_WICCF|nr:Retinal dehydrogenase [Wickerhamomyces ciferrii]CCH46683.1 Retinal dehydrogenase [Wickerhamomyces ciferrii]